MPTPFIGLTQPTPADLPAPTPGPTWAHQLNTDLDLLDAHDHSSGAGKEIAIQPAGGLLHDGVTSALGIKLDGASLTLTAAGLKVTAIGVNTGDVTIGTANGLSIVGQVLSMALSAPGITGTLSGADYTRLQNTSGTNTGDVTLGTANGLVLVGQALSMTLATAVTSGTISTVAQTIAGSKTFLAALKGQPEAEALLGGADPTFANSMAVTYNVDGTLQFETWTDTNTTFLRRRNDYTYASGRVDTRRTRVYSATDGVTVVCDMTETFTYTGGKLTSSATTRAV